MGTKARKMKEEFKIWRTSRALIFKLLEKYTPEQLNHIPEGFNNNLIWNIGHVIVAQQGLVYKSTGHTMQISDTLFDTYKPGTFPSGKTTPQEIEQLRELLVGVMDQTESDYQKGKFTVFHERTTGTGFHLATVEDAIVFNNYHEGLHLGMMMSIRKMI